MNYYRLNVRFNLEDEKERRVAEYLQRLPQKEGITRNRFAVEALCEYLSYKEEGKRTLHEEIRQMLREELRMASLPSSAIQNTPKENEEGYDEEIKRNVLSDLDDLFG